MLYAIFTTIIIFFIVLFFYLASKKTYFELNLKTGFVWPLLLYKEFAIIFIPLILVQTNGVESFPVIFNLKNNDVFFVSLLVLYAVFVFSLTFVMALRFLPISRKNHISFISSNFIKNVSISRFAMASFLSGFTVLLFAMLFLDYKHAFLRSIILGDNLLQVRLENVYSSKLPTQLSYLVKIASQITAIYASFLYLKGKIGWSVLCLLGAILLASAFGNKAAPVMCIVLAVLSYFSLKGSSISLKNISFYIFLYVPILYFFIFFVASIQFGEITIEEYNTYIINRIGVGQMAGVFETFSIPKLNGDFFWHMIPFARFFVEYIPYDKMLMMVVEGYSYDEMGVKNSFFISEAYGIGGWPLALLSPFIVGFSYAIGIRMLYCFIQFLFGNAVANFYAMPLYLLSSPLTGDFSSFPLLKGLILNFIILLPIWVVYKVITFFSRVSTIGRLH